MGLSAEWFPVLDDATPVRPLIGLGLGFLDPTGVDASTMLHRTPTAGIRWNPGDAWFLTATTTFHWAQKRIFGSKSGSDGRASADRTDRTFDLGAGYRF